MRQLPLNGRSQFTRQASVDAVRHISTDPRAFRGRQVRRSARYLGERRTAPEQASKTDDGFGIVLHGRAPGRRVSASISESSRWRLGACFTRMKRRKGVVSTANRIYPSE